MSVLLNVVEPCFIVLIESSGCNNVVVMTPAPIPLVKSTTRNELFGETDIFCGWFCYREDTIGCS